MGICSIVKKLECVSGLFHTKDDPSFDDSRNEPIDGEGNRC
jgi:hypothetical protein